MVIRSALLYEAECWPIKKSQVQRMRVAEMRMIRFAGCVVIRNSIGLEME